MWSRRSPKSQALSVAQASLVGGDRAGALAVGERSRFRRHRPPPGSSPCSSSGRSSEPSRPGGPAFLVHVGGGDELLEQAQLVVGVENGEVGLQARPARHGGAASWRRSHGRCRARACPPPPRRCMRPTRSRISRAALLVKVTARNLGRPGVRVATRWARRAVSAAVLPVPGAGQHQHWPFGGEHGVALGRVEAGQIGRLWLGWRSGRSPANR